jgi:hypothetical protein
MFFTIFLTICLITLAPAFPHQKRQEKAQIVSHCTVPNTVALTFVWKTNALMGDEALICSSFQDDGPFLYLYGCPFTMELLLIPSQKRYCGHSQSSWGCRHFLL